MLTGVRKRASLKKPVAVVLIAAPELPPAGALGIGLAPERVHLFDPVSERRIA